jgi:hypothetical protein
LYSSSAPSFAANPFEDNDDEDDSDDEYSDGSSLSGSGDQYEAGCTEPGFNAEGFYIGHLEKEIDLGQQKAYVEEEKWDLGIGIDMTLKVPDSPVQSKMSAAGVFGGLFSGSNSNMGTLFGGYSSPLAELMSDTTGANGNITHQSVSYDDDDFADDDVVFRPAFSRSNAIPSPSLPLPPPFSGEIPSRFNAYVGGPSIIPSNGSTDNLAVDNQNGLNYGLGTSRISSLMSDNVTSTIQPESTAVPEDNLSTIWQPWNSNDASLKPYQESPIQIPVGGSPMVYNAYDAEPPFSSNNGDWNRNLQTGKLFIL